MAGELIVASDECSSFNVKFVTVLSSDGKESMAVSDECFALRADRNSIVF